MKEGVLFSELAGPATKCSTNKIPARWRKRTAHDQERQEQEQEERPEQSADTKERPEQSDRTTRRKLSWALTLSSQWY